MFGLLKRAASPEVPPAPPEASAQPPARPRDRQLRRAVARMFAAAQTDRLSASWGGTPLTADQIVLRNQRVLVARAREQAANNDYARSFLRMCRQNIVGPSGVVLQAQSRDERGALDQLANEAIEAAWASWGHRANCDVTGRRSWRAIQRSCVNAAAKDGEFMVRMLWGADAGPWGFALQTLDPQRCPVDLNDERPAGGGFIRHGIRFNRFGRPLEYLFSAIDETEADYHIGGRHFVRVPADEIVHGFLDDMEGQKRGLPWMATGLFRMRHLNGLEDAAVINARVSAAKMGFIQWKDGHGPEPDDEQDLEIDAEPGSFPVLPEGAELKDWAPQYPAGEFAPFYKAMLRGIAAGMGVAYNNLANDLEGVNFSSIRQGTLDEREHWKELQEWLIESLVQPVFEAWLPRALLAGRITVKGRPLKPERIDRYAQVCWQPRRWQWIDPRADVDAAVSAKNNLLSSPGQIIREQGRDPQSVWREVAADIAAMQAAGIPERFIALAMGQKLQPTPTGSDNAKDPSA